MLIPIIVIVALAVAALLGYAATKPAVFRVRRAASMKAPPERILPHIQDFHAWGAWSPWEKIDPDMKRTFDGPESGKGAVYGWEGNRKIGSGRMEILEVDPPSRVKIKLDFFTPFEGHNVAEFTLRAEGDATTVTWSMEGPHPFFMRLMTVFFSMDAMIGGQFETGLANLRTIVEK